MKQKILFSIIIIALIVAALSLQQRFVIENNNKKVELVFDDKLLGEFKRENDIEKELLPLLKEHGLTGIAVHEESIEDLLDVKGIWLFTGDDIIKNRELTGKINPFFEQYSYDSDSAFLVIQNQSYVDKVEEYFTLWNKEDSSLQYDETDRGILIFFPEWDSRYQELSGFDSNRISQIKAAGLDVVLRCNNSSLNRKRSWIYLDELAPEYVIFSGDQVLGYQVKNTEMGVDGLERTATIMKDNNIKLGMIEPFIASFQGNDRLARLLNYDLVRVHSIQKEEMAKYSFTKIVNRYLRAVKERDVRLLYLKPFFQVNNGVDNSEQLIKLNNEYLETLRDRLSASGYIPGQASPFPFFENSFVFLIIIGLGIIAAGIILLEYLIGIELNKWKWILLFSGLVVEIVLLKQGYHILMSQILALASSIIFPSLAVIIGLLAVKKKRQWLFVFVKITVISLVGAFLLAASLNHISFLLKVDQFRGVKLAFLLPLVVVSWFYFKERVFTYNDDSGQKLLVKTGKLLIGFFDYNIKVKHLLFLLIVGVGGLFYIGRTGNYSIFSVPVLENKLRVFLEQFLYVRPRFKEFLIGHPLLLLALGLWPRLKYSFLFYPVLLLGTIGQINLVNTFAHIHMSLSISVIRTVNGLWLGLILGCILLFIVKGVLQLFDRYIGENRMRSDE